MLIQWLSYSIMNGHVYTGHPRRAPPATVPKAPLNACMLLLCEVLPSTIRLQQIKNSQSQHVERLQPIKTPGFKICAVCSCAHGRDAVKNIYHEAA